MPAGRPTKYSKKYAEMAEVACREGGFTDLKLAKLFGVSKSTINLWKKEYPEFSDSAKRGKDDFDSDEIEKSLARRATGYKYSEITRRRLPIKQPDGEIKYELVPIKIVKKDVAPDTGACGMWLFNRRPDRWKNKQQVEHSGEIKTPSLVINIAKKNGD